MKFPISHCIETKYLTFKTFCLLMTKLISDGYHRPSMLDTSQIYSMWRLVGVNPHGDIMLYDNNRSYVPIDNMDEEVDNVLPEQWLKEYLNV
jgi:hypothetical protein